MPRILITQACTVTGETVARPVEINDVVDVPKDEAATLCRLGRALYVSRDDDATKGGLTATAEDKALTKRAADAVRAAREQRRAAAGGDLAAAVAAELARLGISAQAAQSQSALV